MDRAQVIIPYSWSYQYQPIPQLYITGYTSNSDSIKIIVDLNMTYTIKLDHPITPSNLDDIARLTSSLMLYQNSDNTLICRMPYRNRQELAQLHEHFDIREVNINPIQAFWAATKTSPYNPITISTIMLQNSSEYNIQLRAKEEYILPNIENINTLFTPILFTPTILYYSTMYQAQDTTIVAIISTKDDFIPFIITTLALDQGIKNATVYTLASHDECIAKLYTIISGYYPDLCIAVNYQDLDIINIPVLCIQDYITRFEIIDYEINQAHNINDLYNNVAKITGLSLDSLWNCCNLTGITPFTLLQSSYHTIIKDIVYNISESMNASYHKSKPEHLLSANIGIYRQVYQYDYSDIYRNVLLLSDDDISVALALKLENAPSKLISASYYLAYTNHQELDRELQTQIASFGDSAFEIKETKYLTMSDSDNTLLVGIYPIYIKIDDNSEIYYDDRVYFRGTADICHIQCKAVKTIVEDYVISLIDQTDFSYEIDKFDLEDYILTTIVDNNYVVNSVEHKLYMAHGQYIEHKMMVSYIMTRSGPQIYHPGNYDIDYEFYNLLVRPHLELLANLPLQE